MPQRFPVFPATRTLGVLVALLALVGCTVTERQVAQQGGRIDDLQEKVLRLERALNEATIAPTASASDPQAARRLADLGQRVEELAGLARDLEGRVAAVESRGPTTSPPPAPAPGLASRLEELSARIGALEARPAPPKASPLPPPTSPAPATIPIPQPAPAKRSSQDLYDSGYRQYKEGRFQEARETLRQYVDPYPDTPLTDNAVFWIGELYDQAKYEQAILEYDKVVQKYPSGDKVSSALLKQAFAFDAIGDPVDARILLKKILREHPSSEQAAIAKRKLEILGE